MNIRLMKGVLREEATSRLADLRIWERDILKEFLVAEQGQEEANAVVDLLASPKHAVALYGPTKAGKTTLILKLFGVDEVSIGHVLRGNANKDLTGTPTATIYERSPYPIEWQVIDDHGIMARLPADEDAESWLHGVRQRMEHGHVGKHPLRIGIPHRHFQNYAYVDATTTQLIDLPGHSGGLTAEQEHARLQYEYIAAKSSLILHVYPISVIVSAGGMAEIATGIPHLDQWYDYVDRSCFIITHTVTDASIHSRCVSPGIKGQNSPQKIAEEVIRHVRNQLKASGISVHGDLPIIPLEYGKSWRNSSMYSAEERDQIETMFDGLYRAIATRITKAQRPYPLFDLSAQTTVVMALDKQIERTLNEIRALEATCQRANDEIEKSQIIRTELQEEISKFIESKNSIREYRADGAIPESIANTLKSGSVRVWEFDHGDNEKLREIVRKSVENSMSILIQEVDIASNYFIEKCGDGHRIKADKIKIYRQLDELKGIELNCDDYVRDWRYLWFKKRPNDECWKSKKNDCHRHIAEISLNKFSEYYRSELCNMREYALKIINNSIDGINAESNRHDKSIEKTKAVSKDASFAISQQFHALGCLRDRLAMIRIINSRFIHYARPKIEERLSELNCQAKLQLTGPKKCFSHAILDMAIIHKIQSETRPLLREDRHAP